MVNIKIKKEGDREFESISDNSHNAVCIGVFELGQKPTNYGMKDRVLVCWEVDEVYSKGEKAGKRKIISNEYTLAFGEKAFFRVMVENWRGKKFEVDENFNTDDLFGKPCIITTQYKQVGDKGYTNIVNISRPLKGMKVLTPQHNFITDTPEWVMRKMGAIDPNGNVKPSQKPKVVEEDDNKGIGEDDASDATELDNLDNIELNF